MKQLMTIVLLLNFFSFPQTSKEEILEQIKSRGDIKITEEANDIYRFEYLEGGTQHFYLGKTEKHMRDSVPTTVIEVWNIDTNLYREKYYFWQEVPLATSSGYELIIGDINNNGLPEIYGHTKDYEDPLPKPVSVYERNCYNQFVFRYEFQDSLNRARGIYDLKNNDQKELLLNSSVGNAIFYTSPTPDSVNFIEDFVYARYSVNNPGQMDDPKFGDFDKNGITDMLFCENDVMRGTIICEYNFDNNNFNVVAEILYSTGFYAGYAIDDLDNDNKTDIVYGGIYGDVYVIEAESEHNYSIVWNTSIEGSNAYWHTTTKDIDKNGKPEFWIVNTTYYGGADVTRITSFEYTVDNEYKETHRIDLVGIYPFYSGNIFAIDVDKDGSDEIVMCFSNYIFIMKYQDTFPVPSYQIFYMTRNNIPGGFFGVTMYDLDEDGYEELLIHRGLTRNDGLTKHVTHVFKPAFIVSVDVEVKAPFSGSSLEQNYPNPFNPFTTISYSLPQKVYVNLKVFDVLGNEVVVLDEGEKPKGIYTIQWNGKDKFQNSVSSGIYFINLATPVFNKTVKGVMLK